MYFWNPCHSNIILLGLTSLSFPPYWQLCQTFLTSGRCPWPLSVCVLHILWHLSISLFKSALAADRECESVIVLRRIGAMQYWGSNTCFLRFSGHHCISIFILKIDLGKPKLAGFPISLIYAFLKAVFLEKKCTRFFFRETNIDIKKNHQHSASACFGHRKSRLL